MEGCHYYAKKKNTGESTSTIKWHLYCFTVQRNNVLNHIAKTSQEYLEDRFTNKQQLNMTAIKAWQNTIGDETMKRWKEFGEVHWLQTSGSYGIQRIFSHISKTTVIFTAINTSWWPSGTVLPLSKNVLDSIPARGLLLDDCWDRPQTSAVVNRKWVYG